MKRKILASLMCLLMMATLLPVGSVAAENAEILTNGDFEGGVDSNGIPNGWTEFDRVSAEYSSGLITGEDIPAESVTAVTPHKGASFKIKGNVDYYQKLNNLVEGKKYLVEGYVNAPVNNQGPVVFIGRGNHALTTAGNAVLLFNYYRNGAPTTGAGETLTTGGWLRFTNVFQYSPNAANSVGGDWYLVLRNLNDNPVYYDSISITEVSDNVLFCEQFNTFANHIENDLKPSILDTTVIDLNYGGIPVVDSGKNGVLEIPGGALRQTGMTLSLDNVVTGSATIRVSFRAKNNSGTTGLNTVYVGPYPNAYGTPQGVTLDLSQNDGDWTYYEFIFDYTNGSWNKFKIYKGQFTSSSETWYLDDLVIEKVGDAFVGEGKTLTGPVETVFTDPEGLTITSRQFLDAPVLSTETVKPFVRFATAEENGDTALTMTAVYKNEGSKRQLLNVITEKLDATASAAAYSTGSIDLSTLGLTAADGVTYTVETYLWDDGSIKPMTNKVSSPITVATATE